MITLTNRPMAKVMTFRASFNELEDSLPIDMTDYQYLDDYYYIKDIDCFNCQERQDFYLKQGVARCSCCHEIVKATKQDFNSVANRSPRAGGLRFKGIFDKETRLSHFKYMAMNGLPLTHSN